MTLLAFSKATNIGAPFHANAVTIAGRESGNSMAWVEPEFDRMEVNSAGRLLGKAEFPVRNIEALDALSVLNNWRSAHAYPLNTFQITLRNKGRGVEKGVIVAQRIKRLDSIHAKLARETSMRMSQMQYIAGCRAVFKSMNSVRRLLTRYRNAKFDHVVRGEKDYISSPKPDGYRSYHIVYEYRGTPAYKIYDGLKVEIQVRTLYQHAWATAVEAVGIFTKQALKSNQGDQNWLRFFALMSTAIAAIEQCPAVPDTPLTVEDLILELQELVDSLHVREMLLVYNTSIRALGSAKDAKYFLLQLDPEPAPGAITIWRYKAKQSAEANRHYTQLEGDLLDGSATQVVLVSVENITALKRAYPNYFLDTDRFSSLVDRVLEGEIPTPVAPGSPWPEIKPIGTNKSGTLAL